MQTHSEDGIPSFLSDCRIMLRFARRNGLELSKELGHEIARVDVALNQLGLATISEMPPSLVALSVGLVDDAAETVASPQRAAPAPVSVATVTASDPPMGDGSVAGSVAAAGDAPAPTVAVASLPPLTPMEAVIRVHGDLTRVIFPATALSLQTSEPPPGRHRFLGGMPLVVKAAAVMALMSAVAFVVSAGFIAHKKRELDVQASTDAKPGKPLAPPSTGTAPPP